MEVPASAAAKRLPRKPPFQFGLKHLLAVPIAVALCFVAYSLAGASGAIVFVAVCMVAAAVRYPRDRALLLVAAGMLLGVALFVLPAIDAARQATRRRECPNNLKRIALGLHSYHDTYGCFPPAYVADQNGRPMHSWRVLILPFIEQEGLYKQYRFEEPWDGPNNRKLADLAIEAFNCPSDHERPSPMTSYVAVVGPETAWPGTRSTKLGDITDGTSNTLLVVEVADSGIYWTEPRDLHVLQMAPTINPQRGQGISSPHPGGAQASLADGSVRYLSEELSTETLRALLTIAGREPIDPNSF